MHLGLPLSVFLGVPRTVSVVQMVSVGVFIWPLAIVSETQYCRVLIPSVVCIKFVNCCQKLKTFSVILRTLSSL